MISLIDTHCHLDFDRYDEDRDSVIQRALDAGVQFIINPATDQGTSVAALALAKAHPAIYAAVGFHPNSAGEWTDSSLAALRALGVHQKVVAIGEIGLDYHWTVSPKEVQWQVFEAQLALAAELALPVIVHNRDSSEDCIAILERWTGGLAESQRACPGVMHSFSAPESMLDRVIAMGFYIGITGPVTYKKADELRRIVHAVPADRLLIETDGPFLTPNPYRGKRNEPAYVQYVADRIAGVRQTSLEEIAALTSANARRLFALPEVTG